MRTRRNFLVMALIAIFGIVAAFTACDNETTPNGNKDPLTLEGTITISPATPTTGTLLTANYSGSETVSYQWNKDGSVLAGKTAATTWVQTSAVYSESYRTTIVFETASTYRVSYKGLQHPHPTGTYTVNGNTLTMTDDTGSQNYVISGNTFSWSSSYASVTWTKQ